MKKNEEYTVKIVDNGYQGEGIAKIQGIPVFIENAIKNEIVKIKILKVNKNFAYGKILEIIEPSKDRVQVDCKTYPRCGGCDLRHIEYKQTLKMKEQVVTNCMNKNVKSKVIINSPIGMKTPYFYRNKLQYPVGIDNHGNPVIGIYAGRSHSIIETDKCLIQNEKCQEVVNDIFKFIKENKITAYDEKKLKGTIRHIVVRIGVATNEVLVGIVVNDDNLKNKQELVNYIKSKHTEIKTIIINYNKKNTNVILGDKNEVIYGKGYIYDKIGKYTFKISLQSFYQVNPIQTEILYNTAIDYAKEENSKNKIALDLYCGIGTIGIFASEYFKKVYGIELVRQAIEDAKENANINNIENIEFSVGRVEEVLPKIVEKNKILPDVVFVDPPRKGLDEKTIEFLLKIKPEKIIYISCNPATLARDLSKLEEIYKINEIQPVDMFPYTRTRGMRGVAMY